MNKKILILIITMLLLTSITIPVVGIKNETKKTAYKIKSNKMSDIEKNPDDYTENWALLILSCPLILAGYKLLFNDTIHIYRNLVKHGWKRSNIKIVDLFGVTASKKRIIDGINWLESMEDEDDKVLIYFSLHGGNLTDTEPLDEPDGMDECIGAPFGKIITDDELGALFNKFDSKQIIAIFSSCHSGGMIDGDMDLKGDGRVILTACRPYEFSFEYGYGSNTAFSYFIIEGLKGAADKNQDKNISAEELFDYAKVETIKHIDSCILHDLQHPMGYDGYPSEDNNESELHILNLDKKAVLSKNKIARNTLFFQLIRNLVNIKTSVE